jgi:hypothetical protein
MEKMSRLDAGFWNAANRVVQKLGVSIAYMRSIVLSAPLTNKKYEQSRD